MIRRSDNEFQDICTTFGLMTLTWAWHPEMKAYDTSHESEALTVGAPRSRACFRRLYQVKRPSAHKWRIRRVLCRVFK